MTEVNPAFALQNAGATHTAANDRMMLSGLGTGIRASTSLIGRGGVNPIAGGLMTVAQTGSPSMAVLVGSGIAYVPGTEGSVQGVYACTNDATVTLSIDAAHATLPRIDLVVAKVEDDFYSGSTNAWSLAVVTGSPNVSPSAPAAPNNSLTLAQVAVGANVTSITNANITDTRVWFTASGGIIPCTSSTKPALNTVHPGQAIYLTDTAELQFKQDNAWVTKSVSGTQTTFTPTWTTLSGGAPSIGNGTLTGRWTKIGTVGFAWYTLIGGSTTNFGGGTWEFTLPSGWTSTLTVNAAIGGGYVRDNSAPTHYGLTASLNSGLNGFNLRDARDGVVSNGAPMTWANGDTMYLSLQVPLTA